MNLNGTKLGKYSHRALTDKVFHVSPFNNVSGKYEFKFSDPRKLVQVNINQLGDDGSKIMATFLLGKEGSYVPLNDRNVASMVLKYASV